MMSRISLSDSLARIKASLQDSLSSADLEGFITKYLRLGGRRISFKKREYQQRILQSDAHVIAVKKCSQVGISELMIMRNLALTCLREPFNIIHALPTAAFAQKIAKTRIDPLIQGSDYLSGRLNKNLDNASVKQIGHSFLYVNGTYGGSSTSAISIPADLICVDELDFCDPDVVSNLQSRLTASTYRGWAYVSTPTTENYGIDAKFKNSKRYFNHCKCEHCGHWFLPSYLKHARIPGYSGDLLAITAADLAYLDWRNASYHCPNCGKVPSLLPDTREWVCENPLDNFEADGFMIAPTDAPEIISASDLVSWSTRFPNKNNFINFHLGETAESSDTGINQNDLDKMVEVGKQPLYGFKVFGLDMGTVCHLVIAVTDGQGKLVVTDLHAIRYTDLDRQLNQLIDAHRPTAIVVDSQPYVETVHRLQQSIPNLFGSVYITSRNLEEFRVINRAENPERALLDVRQVNVNRNLALNNLMINIRSGNIGINPCKDLDLFNAHLLDMKRRPESINTFTGDGDGGEPDAYVWVKTTGNDHYHHALLYAYVASQMVHQLPTGHITAPLFLGSFKVKQ